MKKIKLLISIIFLIVILLNSNNIVKAALNITKIEITKDPTKTKYKVGESFDKTGMEIIATYSDGS